MWGGGGGESAGIKRAGEGVVNAEFGEGSYYRMFVASFLASGCLLSNPSLA